MRARTLTLFVGMVALVAACEDDDVVARYRADLTGAAERPNPVTTNGSGVFIAELNEDNILSYTISWQNLNSNTTLGHIHGPATPAQAIGVLIDFNAPTLGRTMTLGSTSGTAQGTIDMDLVTTGNANVSGDSLRKLLDNGNAYVNIHSSAHGGGEIRGQIVRQ